MYGSDGFLLESLDGVGQPLHVVVVDIGKLLEPRYVTFGRHGDELPTRLAR